jgi:hypothetical protein
MKTERSDIGYPEEQPEEVHDETTKPQRSPKKREGGSDDPPDKDKSKATSTP